MVVFGVVERSLEVVAGADGLFAMVVFAFVGVEVYFSEESIFFLLVSSFFAPFFFCSVYMGAEGRRTFSRDALVDCRPGGDC